MRIFNSEDLDETLSNFEFNNFYDITEFNNIEFNNCLFKDLIANNVH